MPDLSDRVTLAHEIFVSCPNFTKEVKSLLMGDCVFCKIVRGEIPAEKIAEDNDFVAFLSITPVYDGLTVIATKQHYGSYLYQSLSDDLLTKMHLFACKVALLLDKSLGCERCVQVMEGLEVNHAHIKLFPKYKGIFVAIKEKEIPDTSRLKEVAEKIRKAGGI